MIIESEKLNMKFDLGKEILKRGATSMLKRIIKPYPQPREASGTEINDAAKHNEPSAITTAFT